MNNLVETPSITRSVRMGTDYRTAAASLPRCLPTRVRLASAPIRTADDDDHRFGHLAVLAPPAAPEQPVGPVVRPTHPRRAVRLVIRLAVVAVSAGLRGLGYSCSDAQRSRVLRTQLCSRTQYLASAEVRLITSSADGTMRAVGFAVDEGATNTKPLVEVLEVLGGAVGFADTDRAAVLSAVSDHATQPVQLNWGTFTPATDGESESMLQSSAWDGPLPVFSPARLEVPMDLLSARATEHGYVGETPQIRTIRSCTRSEGGYFYDLWMEGADASVASLYLNISSTYHTGTRRRWVQEMEVVLSWVETDQGRMLRSWLAQSASAPGGIAYVAGLRVSFLVRTGEYTKETFGAITADCYQQSGDVTGCAA